MVDDTKLNQYYNIISNEHIFSKKGNLGTPKKLSFYLTNLLKKIDIKGKRILDIGSGSGVFSVYLSLMNAKSVYCLEPELSGSSKDTQRIFSRFINELQIKNIIAVKKPFQEMGREDLLFDIILLHNSINHLDENACSKLHDDPNAKQTYEHIFQKLYQYTAEKGCIIIADCSRYNFFPSIGIKNPIAPTINWKYHQPPKLWKRLLENAGYQPLSLTWTSISKFGNAGLYLLSNKIMSYFLLSHFILKMKKPILTK